MPRDLRHAFRTLARSPGYSITVVLTLALGIGGTAAVYSILRSVILRPFHWAPSDRVMMVAEQDSAGNVRIPSYPTFQDWRVGTNAFDALAFVRGEGAVLKTGEGAERLVGAFVTEEYFRVLPETAAIGRTPEPADFAPGAPAVAAISWPLWQRRFGSDRGVIGRSVTLGERSYTIVGVMPIGFTYPVWADLWAPITTILSTTPALQQRGLHTDGRVIGRLREGVDSAAGVHALSAVAARLAETYPAENEGWHRVAFLPVAAEILGSTGDQLRLLTAAAVFVLLIACVNVGALALARAGARSRELAIRTALGGGRLALLRLLAAECLVLGVVACALGLGAAGALVGWLRVRGRDMLPRAAEVAVDPWAIVAAGALAVGLVVAVGVLPALRSPSLLSSLRSGAGAGAQPVRRRLRAALVVGQIALALVLLAGTGLLLRSLDRLQRVPTGFDEERLLVLPITPPSSRYETPERALQLYREVARAVSTVPGVQSVALTNHVPLSGASIDTPLEVEGAIRRETDQALFRVVDTAYFRTAGIPIVRGRDFTAGDLDHPGDAALVNEALAARYWPGGDALGKRITVRKSAQGRPDFGEPVHATIVGVVGNVRHYSLDTDFVPEVYLPYTITAWGWMSLVIRSAGEPSMMVPAVTRAARSVEPDLPLDGASNLDRVYDLPDSLRQSLAYRRLITGLLGALATPALLLAGLGLYGVVSYLVAQRRREIGVRVALGARRADVLALVLGEGMRLAGLGVVIGTLGAIATTRWLASELYQTSATDPVTFIGAALILAAISLGATLLPARRATDTDPAQTLRAE